MPLDVGTVIVWRNFTIPNIGSKQKHVLLLYLGRDDIMETPQCLHFHRFTTQTKQDKTLLINFSRGQYGIFDDACVLDFNERPYSIESSYYATATIQSIGKLTEDIMKQVWDKINRSKFYSKFTRKSISDSYQRNGITIHK